MPMYKKSLLILLGILLFAAAGMMYGYSEQQETLPLDAAEKPTATGTKAEITVYVSGAVNRPGVISLAEGSRVVDAVNACGGVLPTADAGGVNMAQALKDGMQVKVPEKMAQVGGGNAAGTGTAATGKQGDLININTADEKALEGLPGIGPAMAKRIIEYRTANGAFQSPEDLKKIKGIGEAKYNKMKDKVTV